MGSPFNSKKIGLLVKGMKAALRKPTMSRLTFESAHIRTFMRRAKGSNPHWRAAVVISVCFSDLLRFFEMVNVKLENISLNTDCTRLSFHVQKSKNHRTGFDVCLTVSERRHCVGALRGASSGSRGRPVFSSVDWTVGVLR